MTAHAVLTTFEITPLASPGGGLSGEFTLDVTDSGIQKDGISYEITSNGVLFSSTASTISTLEFFFFDEIQSDGNLGDFVLHATTEFLSAPNFVIELNLGNLGPGAFVIDHQAQTSGRISNITPPLIPEPGAIALLGVGLLGLGAMRQREKRRGA